MEKVYSVEFMEYTNCLNTVVSNNAIGLNNSEYLTVGPEPFLVRESDLEKYSKFGKGFRSIYFVGNINDGYNT